MCVFACFIKGKNHKKLQFPRLSSLEGFQFTCWLLLIDYHIKRERKKAHNSLSTSAYQVVSSFPHLLLNGYRAREASKTQAELTQLWNNKSSLPHFGSSPLYKFAPCLGWMWVYVFHVQRQAAVNGKPAVYSLQHVPDTAACILIDNKSLFGRNIYFTHSLIYVHKKRPKLVNPRYFHLQPISKIPVQFWRSQYFIVDWKNLRKREK